MKLTAPLLIATIALVGCGRLGDSRWNPLSWGSAPTRSLEPEGGYAQVSDTRHDIPQITAARWERADHSAQPGRGRRGRRASHRARGVRAAVLVWGEQATFKSVL